MRNEEQMNLEQSVYENDKKKTGNKKPERKEEKK